MIKPKTYTEAISLIKERLDIVDVVSEYVILKKSGRNYMGCCPFHKEKTPSFSVNPERQIYKCFGCGEGGDALSFLMKINNQSFNEVISELAQKFGIPLPEFKGQEGSSDLKKQIFNVNELAAEYFEKNLFENPTAQKALDYLLEKRKYDKSIIKKYRFGYSSNKYDELLKYLSKEHNISTDLMEKAGLISQSKSKDNFIDRFRGRLMIPIEDENSNIVGFGARTLEEGQNPKYLNSPETLVYNKSRIIYGLNKAKSSIREQDAVVVMEGYFDVITAQVNGVENAVATCGTALTKSHIKNLSRYMTKRKIYLAFDADAAGQMAIQRGVETVKEAFEGLGEIKQFDDNFNTNTDFSCEIRVINTPEGKDPDEFIKTHGAEAYKTLVEKAPLLIDYEISTIINKEGDAKTPQQKAAVIKKLIPLLFEVKNEIIKEEYIKKISKQLDIAQNAINKELSHYKGGTTNNEIKIQRKTEISQIVKKITNKCIIAQKNLLSVYFINENKIAFDTLNSFLNDVEFIDENLILIKNTLKEISKEVTNKQELEQKAMDRLVDNSEAKKELIDIIFMAQQLNSMNARNLKEYIEDNISVINEYPDTNKNKQLKAKYKEAQDEISSLQLQYELREQLKKKYSRLETN